LAVKIRLKRVGTTKKALWRVVVADSRMPRDGRFIEEVGTYDPMKDPAVVSLNADRVRYWVSKGAKPSETVQNLMKTKGL